VVKGNAWGNEILNAVTYWGAPKRSRKMFSRISARKGDAEFLSSHRA
jgi:hypothetical protein